MRQTCRTIATVTLNAAIDKTYTLPSFPRGAVTRAKQLAVDAGGKGINVARVAKQLGGLVIATGFSGGFNGQFIERELTRAGIAHDFVRVEEESRLCLTFLEETDGSSTELIEPGPFIPPDAAEALRGKVRQLAARSGIVCLSGSIPAGVPEDIYAELVRSAREEGAAVFLDASGEALRAGLTAAPDWIKPNEAEAGELLGIDPKDEQALAARLIRMSESGVGGAVVSLGARGSLAAVGGRCYRITSPPVRAVNPVGSGDAFLAGLAVATVTGEPTEQALRLASAAGAANALNVRAGCVDTAVVASLLPQVTVTRLA